MFKVIVFESLKKNSYKSSLIIEDKFFRDGASPEKHKQITLHTANARNKQVENQSGGKNSQRNFQKNRCINLGS